jgi:hypothetical protein
MITYLEAHVLAVFLEDSIIIAGVFLAWGIGQAQR